MPNPMVRAQRMKYGPNWYLFKRNSRLHSPGSFFTNVFNRQKTKLVDSLRYKREPDTKKSLFLKENEEA